MKKIVSSIKYLKPYDILSVLIFIIMIPISFLFRIYLKFRKRNIWLVIEEGKYARDNGYFFYKYIREKHPEQECYYVIDKKANDYQKVKKFGNIIQFKSFKHWLYYMCCKYNISSQKNGNPAQALFYFVHVNLGLFNNRVFLQHGVVKDMCDWLLYKNTKFKYFICGAKREYEYVRDNYGYPKNAVQYTGLARFDSLHDNKVNKKQILVMPTWRNWLGREVNQLGETIDFKTTSFYINWMAFLNSEILLKFLEKNDLELLFYPHINMQKYLNKFKTKSKNIKFLNPKTNIQDVLKSSALLITDYSSVFMDYAYMKKPVIYFQFDQEEYRKKQYIEGYFNYQRDGFGPVCINQEEVIEQIKKIYKNNMNAEKKYYDRMINFFELNDQENSKRQYELLIDNEE